jgi:hypothetical protein
MLRNISEGLGLGKAWKTGKVHTGFCYGYLRERDHSEDIGVDGRVI